MTQDGVVEVSVRPCTASDVDVLETAIPSPGQSRFHARRFDAQVRGESTYLIAWHGEQPVGHLGLRWAGPRSPCAQPSLADAPEIWAVGTWPPEARRQGVGTALLLEAEAAALERGFDRVCLGVEIENTNARRLYKRLGYRDSAVGAYEDSWTSTDDDGREVVNTATCVYLVKRLDASAR